MLELLSVGVGQTSLIGIEPPPALETPEALGLDTKTRHSGAGPARLTGLEVEVPLEERGRAAPIRLALAAVEEHEDLRAGSDLVDETGRAAATAAAAATISRERTAISWSETAIRARRRRWALASLG